MFTTAVSTSVARVSNLFNRNEKYQEQSDLFNDDDDQIWTVHEKNERQMSVDKAIPWSRSEAETQAANVKALLQDQLRREKPLAEVSGDSPQQPPASERVEKKRSRRRESGGAAAGLSFDFPQEWLTPQSSPAQRERGAAGGPLAAGDFNLSFTVTRLASATGRATKSREGTEHGSERPVGRPESSGPGQFDEAILAALGALPRQSLVDILRRLAEQRPEEVATAFGAAGNTCQGGYWSAQDPSPVSTATGPLLSPPSKSEATRGASPTLAALSPSPQAADSTYSVPDVVAAAADAAGSGS
eukprot:symbB.v1.2.019921.t1/scaffold1652.1/size121070/1